MCLGRTLKTAGMACYRKERGPYLPPLPRVVALGLSDWLGALRDSGDRLCRANLSVYLSLWRKSPDLEQCLLLCGVDINETPKRAYTGVCGMF